MITRTATFTEVDYNELDDMITKFLNEKGIKWPHPKDQRFECVAEEEWGNDQHHAMTLDGDFDEDDKEYILEGNTGFQTQNILNWMASEGVVPKGEFRINVCW